MKRARNWGEIVIAVPFLIVGLLSIIPFLACGICFAIVAALTRGRSKIVVNPEP